MNARIEGSESRRLARSWQQGLLPILFAAGAALAVCGALLGRFTDLTTGSQLVMMSGWAVLSVLLVALYRPPAASTRFGAANTITLARATLALLLAGLAIEVGLPDGGLSAATVAPEHWADSWADSWANGWAWAVSGIALLALALDGIDGPIARATGQESRFGARFDMETDAFLAFVLAVYIVRSDELDAWILALGTLRYVFVVASWFVPALAAELFPSMRRKAVCVLQVAALCLIISPALSPTLSWLLGVLATLALVGSFARDVHWLLSRPPTTPSP